MESASYKIIIFKARIAGLNLRPKRVLRTSKAGAVHPVSQDFTRLPHPFGVMRLGPRRRCASADLRLSLAVPGQLQLGLGCIDLVLTSQPFYLP